MARTASSSRCWGSALRRESSAGAQVKRRCSWASVSWLPQLELQLGSHFTPQRRCGQGCLTTCCPNTAEGAVELVQLCLVGVQHLGSWLGFEPHLTFSCPNLNKGKLEEKRVRLTTFTTIQQTYQESLDKKKTSNATSSLDSRKAVAFLQICISRKKNGQKQMYKSIALC